MNKYALPLLLLLLVCFIQSCLDSFQDHAVNPVEQPYYRLWGQVIDGGTDSTVVNARIIITMTYAQSGESYAGDTAPTDTILADGEGYYSIDSLYLGQYLVQVYQEEELCFSKAIDFFQYSDRNYNIIIPAPPEIDFKGLVNRCGTSIKVMKATLILTPIELEAGAVMDTRESETTDAGRYVFKDVYPGYYKVEGYKWSYQPATVYVTVTDDGSDVFEFDFCMSYISPP
ncbi:MAG: carboxypeptidase-like regulatory domain-containing protein [Candidatus Marinimicrobia bacterium]|nr:carboxypeptidase-like regulatory domain-containing protein [Candidatus Neomarinimicrobiota bacterium]MCF7851242.1 carboxypeptidase-like regulatory domain-containing protein [Candidatus Neomarinimicrobiota bacterium]MCF7905332.1 carboxypeptidase-like regulatory domain-containing protein [Candidatus Neomarinimicrobiota bacterium]